MIGAGVLFATFLALSAAFPGTHFENAPNSNCSKCNSPPVWTATVMLIHKQFLGLEKEFGFAKMTQDQVKNRTSIFGGYEKESIFSKGEHCYHTIALYDLGVVYQVNLKTDKCKVYRIKWDMPKYGVPEQGKCLGTAFTGSNNTKYEGLQYDTWVAPFPTGYQMIGLTKKHCIPTFAQFKSKFDGERSYTFLNFEPERVDEEDFEIPSQCRNVRPAPIDLFVDEFGNLPFSYYVV